MNGPPKLIGITNLQLLGNAASTGSVLHVEGVSTRFKRASPEPAVREKCVLPLSASASTDGPAPFQLGCTIVPQLSMEEPPRCSCY